ncbi:hypothetical protein B9Z65_1098 [Elsinoe australis]|uniref:Uncharacterized protein n=1 Tax=Elsinoe australis TaxID=40998 RepID=A0A2P8AI95_9PEZI|nr:hypothetical protein B9Z65_1098 [Elsinoe australis]
MKSIISILPLLAASVLAAPTPQADTTSCPTSSFAIYFGESLNDRLPAYPWLDLRDTLRAIQDLDIDTPERATFQVLNNRLYPANNSTIFATVPTDGGSTIHFRATIDPVDDYDIAPVDITVTPNPNGGNCLISLSQGESKYISMQNYKGYMHLTSNPTDSSRWWGAGPFEMVPFSTPDPAPSDPAPALAIRQDESDDQATASCPTTSFAISTGPSLTDNRTAYPWLDLRYAVRADTSLDIDTPERSAFSVVNGQLHPAVVESGFIGVVPSGGGGWDFVSAADAEGDGAPVVIAATVSKKDGRCFVKLEARETVDGAEKVYEYLSMQNYKGYMHLTDDPAYSSRYWGKGPFEMIPWAAPWVVPEGAGDDA